MKGLNFESSCQISSFEILQFTPLPTMYHESASLAKPSSTLTVNNHLGSCKSDVKSQISYSFVFVVALLCFCCLLLVTLNLFSTVDCLLPLGVNRASCKIRFTLLWERFPGRVLIVFTNQSKAFPMCVLHSKQRHNKLWRSHSDSDLSDHHEPICKPGLELNKKEITTSADQIAEVKTMESHPTIPPVFVEHVVPQDENQKALCTKERMICLEFTSREFHAGQIEDELNLNDINGCSSGCCLNEPKFPLDNCHASKALIQPGNDPEMAHKFPDLTVEDLETDALKADMNVHLLPMEELTSRLKDLPMSPDPESPSPQPSCQATVSDFSGDRIDFFSALEKFVELSQETRSRSFSHSRMEEVGGGRNESCLLSVVEAAPSEATTDDQRSSSLSNTPHASEESSVDEEQSKVKTLFMVLSLLLFSVKTEYLGFFTLFLILIKTEEGDIGETVWL